MKKSYVLLLLIIAVLGFGCSREEPARSSKGENAPLKSAAATAAAKPSGTVVTEAGQRQRQNIIVPDDVKGAWKSVKLTVLNKQNNKSDVISASIGGRVAISGTDLKVNVQDFLPDFKMDGDNITSASNNPNNPAAYVSITEGDNEIFAGWIFALYPSLRAFEHPVVAVTLTGYN